MEVCNKQQLLNWLYDKKEKLVVYGAGRVAGATIEYLKYKGVNFSDIILVVSKIDDSQKLFHGLRIYTADEVLEQNKNIPVLVCTYRDKGDEIRLYSQQYTNDICVLSDSLCDDLLVEQRRIRQAECFDRLIEKASLTNERIGLIYPDNIGDWYCLCAALEETENITGKHYVLIYYSERHKKMAEWFSYDGYKIETYRIDKEIYNILWSEGYYEIAHKYRDKCVLYEPGTELYGYTTNTGKNFLSLKLRRPRFREFNASKYYYLNIWKGKTVLIVPQSGAIATPPIWYWNFCAELFRSIGYQVIFNVNPQDKGKYNGECELIPLEDAVGFADYCGMVFAIRCGFLDLLSTSIARMVILSTEAFKPIDIVFNIKNDDERIKTIFFENNDYFFEKTKPFSFIYQEYKEKNQNYISQLHYLSDIESLAFSMCEKKKVHLDLYNPAYWKNRLINDSVFSSGNAIDIEYIFEAGNGKILLKINGIDLDAFRIDIELKMNGKSIIKYIDWNNQTVVFVAEKGGLYTSYITIVDKNSFEHNSFETDICHVE